MNPFNKIALSAIGAGTFTLVTLAIVDPIERISRVPEAKFLPPDAVPEVVSAAEEMWDKRRRDGQSRYTVGSLSRVFSKIDYDFHAVRTGNRSVPRLFVARLPKDMKTIKILANRKELFLKSVLPLVLQVNEKIKVDRLRLIALSQMKDNRRKFRAADQLWLAALADRYKADRDNLSEMIRRVDIIPPSLALAQAAEESGWGTSRFVIEGNALFGQWTFHGERGIVPSRRSANKTHKIKIFNTLLDGVTAYARNLNTHPAYRQFRLERADFRRVGKFMGGWELSSSLINYSERGDDYVKSLKNLIRSNRLEKLDRAKLSDKAVKSVLNFPLVNAANCVFCEEFLNDWSYKKGSQPMPPAPGAG